jgi:DNA mismatch repair protein MutS
VAYVRSGSFRSLVAEVKTIKEELATVTYSILIKGNRFTVTKYEGEPDYSIEVADTFQKFRQGDVKDYRLTFPDPVEMDHVEAIVLDFVAKLHPDVFGRLADFSSCARTISTRRSAASIAKCTSIWPTSSSWSRSRRPA